MIDQSQIDQLEREITDERDRLSSDRMDISFGELINLYKAKELIIRPEYQRLFRWNTEQKSSLIESILLSIPIPPIFVAEDENGIWELVDGLQRVSTFISFFGELSNDVSTLPSQYEDDEIAHESEEEIDIGNNWTLNGASLIESLNGFNIETLPQKYKINLKRAVCRVEILRGESNVSMKYELFKRLNSGGSVLKPQEIRNAIYRQINPQVISLIENLSQGGIFKKLTNLSKQKTQELYDQELVLRFVALYNNVENVNENTENFLNSFMEKSIENGSFETQSYETLFLEVLEEIDRLNNDKVFRNRNNFFVPAFFEGITIGLAQNLALYKDQQELLAKKIEELKGDVEFKRLSGSTSNSRSRIKARLQRANEIFNNVP